MVKIHALKIWGTALVAAFTVFATVPGVALVQAQAQEAAPVILTVDVQRVRVSSKAGQSIAEQMKVIQDTANKELEEAITQINAEIAELQSKQASLEEAELQQEAQRLAILQNNIPAFREVKVRELQATEQKAYVEVTNAIAPILEELVKERGATLLLDRSIVLYHAEDTDVTETVLERLDAKLDTVRVERLFLKNNQEAE